MFLLMDLKKYSFLFFLIILLVSCKKSQINRKVSLLYDSHIELMLDSMAHVPSTNEMISIAQSQYIYVTYVDSMSCSDCTLKHMSDWSVITEGVDSTVLEYIFIIFPKKNDREKVIEKMNRNMIDRKRVYIDTLGVFEKYNSQLPKDNILHSFLLDKNHNIILIGDPLKNSQIEKLLKERIRTKNDI